MAVGFLWRILIFGVIALFGLASLAPETFQNLKESTNKKISDFATKGITEVNSTNQTNTFVEQIKNFSDFEVVENVTYLNLGGIMKETPCGNSLECNEGLVLCEGICFCSEENCLKPL